MPKLKVTAELDQGVALLQTITGQVRVVTCALQRTHELPAFTSNLPHTQDNVDAFHGCKSVSPHPTAPQNVLID